MLKSNLTKLNNILKNTFNLSNFRPIQKEIISSVINQKNTLGIMPTGGGKSLTYQIPGVYLEGLTLVISPLISLMEDQVNFLKSKNISAEFYNMSLSNEKKMEIIKKIELKNLKFLFISPERIFIHENFTNNEPFLQKISQYMKINLIVIDEAHCVSSWGHDFREDYLKLKNLKYILPKTPILTLTATADPLTKQEIIEVFDIKKESVFSLPIERKNLLYNIEKKYGNGFEQVTKIIKKNKSKKGIVYCFKKEDVNKLSRYLKANGINSAAYHADIKKNTKSKVLSDFLNDKIDIVVATIAFGMGIDKSNIGLIIHKDMPKNIESYYQETGRSGRDGKVSKAYYLYSGRDFVTLNWLLNNSNRKEVEKLKLHWMKVYTISSICRKQMLNWYFENNANDKCGKCDNCKKNKINNDITNLKFIKFINKELMNKEIDLFQFEKIIIEVFKEDYYIDYLYQLIFLNYVLYRRKMNTIYIENKIIENIKLLSPLIINDNFYIPPRLRKSTIKRKTSKSVLIKKNKFIWY